MKKMSRITFEELREFDSDLKKLLKKYRSFNEDLVIIRKVLNDEPDESPPFSFRISGLGIKTCIIKIKKIACKSLKGRGVQSGFRLIYAYFEKENRIVFAEIYHKNNKDSEDRDRLIRNFT
jgi:mRNA-degrading endonuclease RelE of RelBE toxin-antitoxin system